MPDPDLLSTVTGVCAAVASALEYKDDAPEDNVARLRGRVAQVRYRTRLAADIGAVDSVGVTSQAHCWRWAVSKMHPWRSGPAVVADEMFRSALGTPVGQCS